MMFEKYDEAKNVITDVVNCLRENKELLFPVMIGASELHEDYLNDIIDAVDNQKFLVSVCGQIKAGKSTLLNALLFNGPLLPAKVTPETATLTKITYGESFNAHVTFYSTEEWSRLIGKSEFVETHTDQFARMEEVGINPYDPHDYLNTFLDEKDESNLEKFISADGPLTLLVKQLEIEHPAVPHKGLIFVDTPGLNDPNIIRSQIAIDWVSKSDAVLFVLHSRGVGQNDYAFMDESMAGIKEESFILVLNRCDELDSTGLERVKKYIWESLTTGSIALKKLISSIDNVIVVSARAALFNRADKSKLKDDDIWHLEKMRDGKLDLILSDGNFADLETAVSEKLIDNKGRNIIRTNANKLNGLLTSKYRFIQMERERFDTQIEQLSGDTQDIEEIIRHQEDLQNRVTASFRSIMDDFDVEAKESENKLFLVVDKAFREIGDEIQQFVFSDESPARIAALLPWKLRNGLHEQLLHGSNLKTTIKSIGIQMDDAVNKAKEELTTALKKEYPGLLNFICYRFSLKSLSDSIDANLSNATYEHFSESIERVLGFLWVKGDQSKNNLAGEIKDILKTLEDRIKDDLDEEVFSGNTQMQKEIQVETDLFLSRIRDDLKSRKDTKQTNKESLAEYMEKSNKLSADICKLEEIRDRTSEDLVELFETF